MKGNSESEWGFALLLVLWVALVTALLVSIMLGAGREAGRDARFAVEVARLKAMEDGVLAMTRLRLLDQTTARHVATDGTPSIINLFGRHFLVSVQDQAGLIDLNFAPHEMLEQLLSAAGHLDSVAASTLADRILDWRERGTERRLNGAKARDYAQAGYSYGPRNRPFETVPELRLVMGMTDALYARISPALTVRSQSPVVDPRTAPREVLIALSPNASPSTIDDILAERQRRHADVASDVEPGSSLVGHALFVQVGMAEKDQVAATEHETIRITGLTAQPFWTY